MHILGLGNGRPAGNSEILLKAALGAAQTTNPSITTSWVRIPSVSYSFDAPPLEGAQDPSMGTNLKVNQGDQRRSSLSDDRMTVLNAILDADGLILASPVYSHQPAGSFKALMDAILGPFTDVAFAKRILERQDARDPAFKDMKIDMRLMKPRVVGFICVAGSSTSDQVTMALPSLHLFAYPLHAKVIDQTIAYGIGAPGAVAMYCHSQVIERVQQLGRNVASQLGRKFDEAEYLGPHPTGACPYCHLAKINFFGGAENAIGCVTCGAPGKLVVKEDGIVTPKWEERCTVSSITIAGKERHIDDIMTNSKAEAEQIRLESDLEAKKAHWLEQDIPMFELPSHGR